MKHMWIVALVLALGVSVAGQVDPLGIIVEPPTALAARVWTEKPAYAVGEYVRVFFEVNQDAYIYIWDIDSTGGVCLIFPNQREMNNFVVAGTHRIPGTGISDYLRVAPPVGTEWLQIVATKQPVDYIMQFFGGFTPGSEFACSPAGRQAVQQMTNVRDAIESVLPADQRAFDFTSFEIVSGPAPSYGTLVVRTSPAMAKLYVDGVFRGYTPRTLNLVPGFHDVLIRKTGYRDYTARVYLVAGRTRTLEVVLEATVPANQPPVALFTFTPINPVPGVAVSFNAASSYDPDGAIVSYQWDFNGDGVFDRTGVNPTWTFPAAGTYNVRLVVTDNRGATGQTTRPVTVVAANQPPVAQFTYTPPSPRPGDWIRFDASTSFDPDGSIVSYQWDFQNDGIFDATGQVVFRQYGVAGTYTVRLLVTDNQGATGQTTQTVTVTPMVANQPPVAQFTFSPPSPAPGAVVTFDGTPSYDPDGTIVSYGWDLTGNGVIDRSGPVVTWTYPVAGTYNATLYVTDNQGATGQTTQLVVVAMAGPPGMPPMSVPGIYVWGTDTWRLTVNGASTWTTPRAYRLELRTTGEFINVSTDAGPMPLGLIPEPVSEGWRIVFEGSVTAGRITHSFQVRNATSIYMDLRLDMDGDGTLDRSPGFVRLRQFMVSPPTNPLVIGSPEGFVGPLVPSMNFAVCVPLLYVQFLPPVVMNCRSIAELEGL